MDCDARATNDFLELCVGVLQNKNIGMVGAQVAPPVADDYTSWYFYAFSFGQAIDSPDDTEFASVKNTSKKRNLGELPELGDTEFIGGSIFALRREVWDEVGGFSGYSKRVHEDSYLSKSIISCGYQLKIISRPFQVVRVFSRKALCRRYWILGRSSGIVEAIIHSGKSLPATQEDFIKAVQSRCESIEKNELTLVFYYYEALIMCHPLLELCNELGALARLPKNAAEDFLSAVRKRLSGYPRLWLLLKSDLLQLDTLPLREHPAPDETDKSALANECDWAQALSLFELFKEKKILDYLEKEGVSLILQDDRETQPHFSGY